MNRVLLDLTVAGGMVAANDSQPFALNHRPAGLAIAYTKGSETDIACELYHIGLDGTLYLLRKPDGTAYSVFGTLSTTLARAVQIYMGGTTPSFPGLFVARINVTGSPNGTTAFRLEHAENG